MADVNNTDESIQNNGIPEISLSLSVNEGLTNAVDKTLTADGEAADAKTVGDRFNTIEQETLPDIEATLARAVMYDEQTEQTDSDRMTALNNIRAVGTIAGQGLTTEQKANARTNIGAVSNAELTQEVTTLQEAIDNASDNYYEDISAGFTFDSSSISKFSSNAVHAYRYGRMVSISIAFGVNTVIPAGTRLFTLPAALKPAGNVYCIVVSLAGDAVALRKADGTNNNYMMNDRDMPVSGMYRGALTYCIAD